MSLVTEEIKAKAEVYYGNEICQEKSKFLLKEVGLPNGLLPLEDMEECGYVKETGFVWLKQKKKTNHKFDKIGRLVSYAPEVTAYVEPNKIKKLTGVKTKELLIWITLSDIYTDQPPTGNINFKIPAGLSRSFPTSAFEVEEVEKEGKGVSDGINGVNEVKAMEVKEEGKGVIDGINGINEVKAMEVKKGSKGVNDGINGINGVTQVKEV